MREIRLCTYSTFQLDAPISAAALCMDDFDNDGEDELAIGTTLGSLHVLKRTGDNLLEEVFLCETVGTGCPISCVVSGPLLAEQGTCLVVITLDRLCSVFVRERTQEDRIVWVNPIEASVTPPVRPIMDASTIVGCVVADVMGDGTMSVVVASSEGHLEAYQLVTAPSASGGGAGAKPAGGEGRGGAEGGGEGQGGKKRLVLRYWKEVGGGVRGLSLAGVAACGQQLFALAQHGAAEPLVTLLEPYSPPPAPAPAPAPPPPADPAPHLHLLSALAAACALPSHHQDPSVQCVAFHAAASPAPPLPSLPLQASAPPPPSAEHFTSAAASPHIAPPPASHYLASVSANGRLSVHQLQQSLRTIPPQGEGGGMQLKWSLEIEGAHRPLSLSWRHLPPDDADQPPAPPDATLPPVPPALGLTPLAALAGGGVAVAAATPSPSSPPPPPRSHASSDTGPQGADNVWCAEAATARQQLAVCTAHGSIFLVDMRQTVVKCEVGSAVAGFTTGALRGGATALAVVLVGGQVRLYRNIGLPTLKPKSLLQSLFSPEDGGERLDSAELPTQDQLRAILPQLLHTDWEGPAMRRYLAALRKKARAAGAPAPSPSHPEPELSQPEPEPEAAEA